MDPYVLRYSVYEAARDGNLRTLKDILTNLNKEVAVELLNYHHEESGELTTPFIIAARRGNEQITEWLLSNYDINLEQTGTVLVTYEPPFRRVTALWAALFAGHCSIVRQLLKHGADANHPRYYNQSPLLSACLHGNPDMMDVLIKHGADVNTTNDISETCLMVTCSRGFNDIVKLMLDKGADIDVKSCDGSTALHKAAKHGHVDIVKTLVQYKAIMQEDDFKMTPLLVAAECGQAEVVEYLVSLSDCTVQQKVDAFELLGASILLRQNYMFKAYKYLHIGMSERYKDSKHHLIKSSSPPKPAYNNHIECQTLAEIESIAQNLDALQMEALTVRERILGEDNPLVRDVILNQADIYTKSNKFDISVTLLLHATSLAQKNNNFGSCSAFADMFTQMINVNADIDFRQLLQAFELVLTATQYGMRNSGYNIFTLSQNKRTCIYLILIMMKQSPTEKQIEDFHLAVYRFLKLRLRYYNEYTPLHMAMDVSEDQSDTDKVLTFPNNELCDLLVNCGADVNALDVAGNTPLHVLAKGKTCVKNSELVKRCALSLIRHGAHLDVKNQEGKTAIEVSVTEEITEIIRTHSKISLKCLASRAIKRYGILFKYVVPKYLEEFVDLH